MVGEIFGLDLVWVIVIVGVVLVAGTALPRWARNLGAAKNELDKSVKELKGGGPPPPLPA
jgi:hypothetical protein